MRETLVRSAESRESRGIQSSKKLSVVARCLDLSWKISAAKSAVEITAEADTICTNEPCHMQGVMDAIREGGSSIVREKLPVEIETDPARAIANRRDLRVGEVTLGRLQQSLRVGVRRDDRARRERQQVVKGRTREMRGIMENPASIERLDEAPSKRSDSARARIAACVTAAMSPRHAHNAQSPRVPPGNFVG